MLAPKPKVKFADSLDSDDDLKRATSRTNKVQPGNANNVRAALRDDATPSPTTWLPGCFRTRPVEQPESVLEKLHWHAEFQQQIRALEQKKYANCLEWEQERAQVITYFTREVQSLDQMFYIIEELHRVGKIVANGIDRFSRQRIDSIKKKSSLMQELLADMKHVGCNTEPDEQVVTKIKVQEVSEKLERTTKESEQMKEYMKALEQHCMKLEQDRTGIEAALTLAYEENANMQESFTKIKNELESQYNKAKKMLDLACVQHTDLQNRYITLQSKFDDFSAAKTGTEEENGRLREAMETCRSDLATMSRAFAYLMEEKGDLKDLLLVSLFESPAAPEKSKEDKGKGRAPQDMQRAQVMLMQHPTHPNAHIPALVLPRDKDGNIPPAVQMIESLLVSLRVENINLKKRIATFEKQGMKKVERLERITAEGLKSLRQEKAVLQEQLAAMTAERDRLAADLSAALTGLPHAPRAAAAPEAASGDAALMSENLVLSCILGAIEAAEGAHVGITKAGSEIAERLARQVVEARKENEELRAALAAAVASSSSAAAAEAAGAGADEAEALGRLRDEFKRAVAENGRLAGEVDAMRGELARLAVQEEEGRRMAGELGQLRSEAGQLRSEVARLRAEQVADGEADLVSRLQARAAELERENAYLRGTVASSVLATAAAQPILPPTPPVARVS
eukprot:tig00021433_g21258.t1